MPVPGNAAISRLPGLWQKVSLELFSLYHIDDQGPVWVGHLDIRRKEFQENPAGAVMPLLKLVGKNYDGRVSVRAHNQSLPETTRNEAAQPERQTLKQRFESRDSEQTTTKETNVSPVSQEKKPAVELELQEACSNKNMQACMTLAELYLKGGETPADPQRAIQLYEQACAQQNGHACTNVGILYNQGIGVPKDPQRAKTLFRQGCQKNDKMGCILSEEIK